MKLKITLTMDNAAFEPLPGLEAGRILRRLAGDLEQDLPLNPGDHKTLRDINGNTVGKAVVTK